MDSATLVMAIEAQFLMRFERGAAHASADRQSITNYSWDEDIVRQALHVRLDDTWLARVAALESLHLAGLCMFAAPVTHDEDGTEHVIEGWEDAPRGTWGDTYIFAEGVLRLAELYGRPYVRYTQLPAVLLDHWTLLEREAEAWRQQGWDEERFRREWPEEAKRREEERAAWEEERERLAGNDEAGD